MSALAKSAIVIGLAIAALVLWPERESPAPELEELPGLAARPEEPALENSVLQPGQLAPRERSAIGSPASATDGEMTPRGRVQVIDKESGVPAPHYGVRVLNAEGEERLVTSDATGEFLLEDELDDRDLTLIAVDHESLKLRNPAQLHLDPETRNTRARAHIFEVDLGPTYRLQLPAGTPRGQLRAFLSTEKYTKSELGGSLERGAVVREGPRPWVRLAPFPGVRTPVLGDEPWYLILHDGLGYWQAWGAVDSIVGVHERIVTFESRLFGRAEIRLRADGLPPRGEMVLHVGPDPRHRAAAGTDDDRLRRRTVSIRKGQELEPGLAVLHYLPEGDYLGQSEAGRGFEFRRVPFEVHGGETTRVELELEQTEGGHDLIVILASESGTVDFSRVVLYAHPTEEGQSKKRWARIELDSPPGEGHYYFENLESGPWRIEIPTIGTFPPFDSENNRIVDADAGEVRFTCLDGSGAEMVSLRVKVVDAETGADVQSPAITFWVDGQSFLSAGLTAGVNQLPSLAAGTRLDCIVQAPGYRPLIFEGGTYPPELPGKEIGEFRLERGWGMVVLTHRVHGGGGPLPGVLVHTDGLPAAVSDAHGRVVLAADEAPRSIKFALDGYQCLSDRDEEAIAKLLSWRGPSPVDVFFQAD